MLIFVCYQLHEAMKNSTIFRFSLCFLIFLSSFLLRAQEREVDFIAQPEGDALRFIPQMPPLQQMAGAPPASWRYYWEFGDGTFSFEEQPVHAYELGGDYEVLLAATALYDHGKPPKEKPKKVKAGGSGWASSQPYPHVLKKKKDAIGLAAVRNPRPEETFIVILSYHNPTDRVMNGQIAFRYNETAFGHALFSFKEARTHYGESSAGSLSMLLPQREQASVAYACAEGTPAGEGLYPSFGEQFLGSGQHLPKGSEKDVFVLSSSAYAKSNFGDAEGWYFQNLQPGETRNLFISLTPTAQMVQDTNVIIHFEAELTEQGGRFSQTTDLAVSIVSSHDPNYLAVDKRRRSYRGIRHEKFKYEVHFQNNGDGPANKIRISVNLPEGLNPESIEVLDYYPQCPICPKGQPIAGSCLDTALYENRVEFTFHNIYLPGTKQEGVSRRDSTKGFVRYVLKPGKKTEKRKMKSRAAIYFDNDAPIVTRPAKTSFKWGVSPGFVAARAFYPDTVGQWRMGFTAAPYKPYKPYFQFEMYAGVGFRQKKNEVVADTVSHIVPGQNFQEDSLFSVAKNITTERFSMEFVPLHLRYNLGGFMAVGGGVSVEWAREMHDVTAVRTLQEICYVDMATGMYIDCYGPSVPPPAETSQYSAVSSYFAPSLFGEFSLGAVRVGPSVGLRAYVPLSDKRKFYLTGFAIWRF